jgi:hypothetical protein
MHAELSQPGHRIRGISFVDWLLRETMHLIWVCVTGAVSPTLFDSGIENECIFDEVTLTYFRLSSTNSVIVRRTIVDPAATSPVSHPDCHTSPNGRA